MFILFALITLLGAGAMILQKNVITAGLCMVLCFFGVAGLFLLLANPVAAAPVPTVSAVGSAAGAAGGSMNSVVGNPGTTIAISPMIRLV